MLENKKERKCKSCVYRSEYVWANTGTTPLYRCVGGHCDGMVISNADDCNGFRAFSKNLHKEVSEMTLRQRVGLEDVSTS